MTSFEKTVGEYKLNFTLIETNIFISCEKIHVNGKNYLVTMN